MQKKKPSPDIVKTTTTLPELLPQAETLPIPVMQKRIQAVQRWEAHFKGVMRIMPQEVTVAKGLQDVRIFQLKATFPIPYIVALVSAQINELDTFLDFPKRMNPEAILDTTEFIIADYEWLSLTAIQCCFNMIKKQQQPLNFPLFNKLNGQNILHALRVYDTQVQEKELFKPAEEAQMLNARSTMENPWLWKAELRKISKQKPKT